MVNKVILVGRLGADPELSTFDAEGVVVNFRIATKRCWKDKRSGERRDRTEWHMCFAFGNRAKSYKKYMKKGLQYYVEGRLETSSYEVDGQTHYSTKIKVEDVQFL